MKKLLCMLLVSSMIFIACEKEEVNSQQELSDVLVTVDFSLILEEISGNVEEGEILMVASGKEGNVLASDKLDANSEKPYIFPLKSSNDFDEDELLLTIMSHDKLNREVILASYLVNRGQDWQFKPEPESWYARNPLNFIYMNVENKGQEKRIGVYGSDNSSGWTPRLGEPRYKIPLYKEPPLDYFIFYREPALREEWQELISYKVLSGIEGREELEVDVMSFSKDYTEYSIAVPDAEDFKISAVANVSDADLYSVELGKLNQGSETTYKFPKGITLGDYLFTVGYEKRGMEFKSVVHSESPELDFREFELDVRTSLYNTANHSVSLSFSKKNFDYHISTFEIL